MNKIVLIALGLLAFTAAAQAGTAGQVTHLSGTLSVTRVDGTAKLLSVKSDVLEGDTLSTQDDSYARVKFADGAEVVLRPRTLLKVEHYAFQQGEPAKDNVLLSMLKGGMRAVTGLIGKRNREKVGITTPVATIGIRGTNVGAQLVELAPPIQSQPDPTGRPSAVVVSNAGGTQFISEANPGSQVGSFNQPPPPPQTQGGDLPRVPDHFLGVSDPNANNAFSGNQPGGGSQPNAGGGGNLGGNPPPGSAPPNTPLPITQQTPPNQPPQQTLQVDVATGSVSVTNTLGQSMILNQGQIGIATPTSMQILPPGQGMPVTVPASIAKNNKSGDSCGMR